MRSQCSQLRRGWLRLLLLAVCLLPLLGLAGCGSASYNCANGCFRGVILSQVNQGISGTPWAVRTSMYVAPLTCDATCRGPNNSGTIVNFVMVTDGKYQISVGYATDGSGNAQFFLQSYLPDVPYIYNLLGATGVTANANNEYHVQATIYASEVDVCLPPADKAWVVNIDVPFPTPNAPTLNVEGYGVGWQGCTAFVPNSVVLGQYLVGTSGGDAEYTYFSYNQYSTTFPSAITFFPDANYTLPASPSKGGGFVGTIPSDFHYIATDGAVSTSPGPPFVGWNIPPSKNTVAGGVFYTVCCTPPCDALIC